MSASNSFETDLLKLILQNIAIAGIGDAGGIRGSEVAGDVYARLHTADPGEAGSAVTNEAAYAGYAPVATSRDGAACWTVTGNAYTNNVTINFPTCTTGTETVTHFSLTDTPSGAGKILLSGAFGTPSSLAISAGITPSFPAGTINGTVD